MKAWLESLLALQALDKKIFDGMTRLETIPAEKQRIASELEEEKAKLEAVLSVQRTTEQKIRKLEADTAALREEIRQILIKSSMVKKSAEYAALMKSIEDRKSAASDLETEELLLLDKVEEDKKASADAERLFRMNQKALLKEDQELEELRLSTGKELTETRSLRDLHASKLDKNTCDVYSHLLVRGKPLPAAPVINGTSCGSCFLKLTPQTLMSARKGILTLCDNCSHIVYVPEE